MADVGPENTHKKLKFAWGNRQHWFGMVHPWDDDIKISKAEADLDHPFDKRFVWNEAMLVAEAPVAPGQPEKPVINTVKPAVVAFNYLDVGVWGDGLPEIKTDPKTEKPILVRDPKNKKRNFGLIWGQSAAVCNFSATPGGPATISGGEPLNEVLAALSGDTSVEVYRSLWTKARNGLLSHKDHDIVYVILPDLHLPLVTKMPAIATHIEVREFEDGEGNKIKLPVEILDTPEPVWGRYRYDYPPPQPAHAGWSFPAKSWYSSYLQGDIFGAADADLVKFLDKLAACALTKNRKIVVVQVGDMYDLWIGLDRFFNAKKEQIVELTNSNTLTASDFIDHWVAVTDANFPALMKAFHGHSHGKTFLWGNHDNYLSRHIAPSQYGNQPVRAVRGGGVYIEHGQRADGFNCDGAVMGHKITNGVFDFPPIRNIEPDRRQNYIMAAAISFARAGDFCAYAMGHTHTAYLTRVIIDFDWI